MLSAASGKGNPFGIADPSARYAKAATKAAHGDRHRYQNPGSWREDMLIDTGAGVGGVATAARLAKAGFKVTVLEKNEYSGGRCSLLHHKGYVRLS